MGQGEEERGEIFFFYRPRVEKEEAHSPDDVQLYLVLRPESGERAVEEKQSPQSGKEGSKKEYDLQGQFGHKKFVPADPPDMLIYEGCELLLISASDAIEEEWETNL
uniref:Uncharacterized protein n=1 Tax=Populus trichocarpa TaxID=3694 RepID=A0A2K1XNQ5_POPTR